MGNEMGNHCHVQSIDCKDSANNIGSVNYGVIDFKNLMAILQIENFADLREAQHE
jgi:hypothetical protein